MEIVWSNIVVKARIGQKQIQNALPVAKIIVTNVMKQEMTNQIIKSIVIAVIAAGKQYPKMEIALKNILRQISILEQVDRIVELLIVIVKLN